MLNPRLQETLQHLRADTTRANFTIRSHNGHERKLRGYVAWVAEDYFLVQYREHASATHYVSRWDTVLDIRATAGKRRKSGMYYETYYRELPYVPTADGALDMTATLKGLLATA